ncbi:hypothetical protein [Guptibacillus algicola]|uniref:hypothetical protein n=1 Tax=Guptibacillus algicola TaxID=225844 RepID=UPI001CD5CEB8|nr:hypothetical protein [Alkalihalobacillus algicola]MCA0987733.1 hypothetical protein [Alkalihalobacillus algicola]
MKRIKFNGSKFIIVFFIVFVIVGAANVLMSDGKMNTSEYVLSETQKDVVSRSETQPKIPVGGLLNSKLTDDNRVSLTAKLRYSGDEENSIKVVEDGMLNYKITKHETDEVVIPFTTNEPTVEENVSPKDILEGEAKLTAELEPGVYQIEVTVPIEYEGEKERFLFRIPVEVQP